jgi:hypothetical protein
MGEKKSKQEKDVGSIFASEHLRTPFWPCISLLKPGSNSTGPVIEYYETILPKEIHDKGLEEV